MIISSDNKWFLCNVSLQPFLVGAPMILLLCFLSMMNRANADNLHLKTLFDSNEKINRVKFTPDGKHVIACSSLGIEIWNRETAQIVKHFGKHINDFDISADGQSIVVGTSHPLVELWDFKQAKVMRQFDGPEGIINTVALSADGKYCAAGTGIVFRNNQLVPGDYNIWVWELETSKLVSRLKGHEGPARRIEFLPNSKQLVSISDDTTMRLWDVQTQLELKCDGKVRPIKTTLSNDGVVVIKDEPTFHYKPNLVISKDGKMAIRNNVLFDLQQWKVNQSFSDPNQELHTRGARCNAFSPDSRFVIAGHGNGMIRVWEIATGREVCAVEGNRNGSSIDTLAVYPEKNWLLSGGIGCIPSINATQKGVQPCDTVIRLWDIKLPPNE